LPVNKIKSNQNQKVIDSQQADTTYLEQNTPITMLAKDIKQNCSSQRHLI